VLWAASCVALAASIVLAACTASTGGPSGSLAPSTAGASPSLALSTPTAAPPTPPAADEIQLRLAPANLACDAIGVPYKSATFRIDATATEQVSAVADTGTQLRTFWSAGFQGGSADERVVRDSSGQVVATDGEVLTIPDGAWPRLHGYFVCPSADALYILVPDPS
jgi:hypothetical protein